MELWIGLFAFMAVLAYAIVGVWRRRVATEEIRSGKSCGDETFEKDLYNNITPLPDFDWETTEPLKLRPFKPKYHLTMGKHFYLLRISTRVRELCVVFL